MTDHNKYLRAPKIYIKLPSGVGIYKPEQVTLSPTGEIGIRGMTARDELLLKTPDALLNSDAIANVIKSCCPDIHDVYNMLAPDVEAIFLGIIYASQGDKLDFECVCPACQTQNGKSIGIRNTLDNIEPINFDNLIIYHQYGDATLMFYIRPYTFKTSTKIAIAAFEKVKMEQYLISSQLEDEEKFSQASKSFEKMAEINFNSIVDAVDKIQTPDGVISDRNEIKDLIFDAEITLISKITEALEKVNKQGVNNSFSLTCHACQHEFDTKVEFDPARFFAQSFRH